MNGITIDESIKQLKQERDALHQALKPIEREWRKYLYETWLESSGKTMTEYADRLQKENAALRQQVKELKAEAESYHYALLDQLGR